MASSGRPKVKALGPDSPYVLTGIWTICTSPAITTPSTRRHERMSNRRPTVCRPSLQLATIMRGRRLSTQLKQLQRGLIELRKNHTTRFKAHGLGRSRIRPGVCGVPHLHQPPCDHFGILRYDLKKRTDASVQPYHLQPWRDPTRVWHPKTSTIGLIGGTIHVMFKPDGIGGKGPYVDPVTVSVTKLLYELAYEANLPDFEIRINGADTSRDVGGAASGCVDHFFSASMASDPAMCDIGLPTGLRVEYTPWVEDADGRLHYDPATGVAHATQIASKPFTKVAYGGGLWAATRCEQWPVELARPRRTLRSRECGETTCQPETAQPQRRREGGTLLSR